MNQYYRDIILYVNDERTQMRSWNIRIEYINDIIGYVDNPIGFCKAHELVNRNRITSNKNKILNATRFEVLKPFRFLINKN